MSYDARLCILPNLVSLRMAEEDARREYMQTAGSRGGLLDCVVMHAERFSGGGAPAEYT